jgi:hypothetical protein
MAARTASGAGRKFWFDPRFAIGLVLIVVAVAGTVFVVAASDDKTAVLTARTALVPGETVFEGDLGVSTVSLDATEELYVLPGDIGADGVVVTRAISAGELVPASAIGSIDGLDVTTVVVILDGQLASSITPGATADLWASAEKEGGGFGPPVVVVPEAIVERIDTPTGIVVDSSDATVEILVPKDAVAKVLEALANSDSLSLVPSSLPAKG